MQIEPLGVVAIALGCLGWMLGLAFSTYVLVVSTLLGAAAAIILPSIGYANIEPSHLMLGFYAVSAIVGRQSLSAVATSLSFPNDGFWLALTALWAVLSALLLPRLFAGSTYVFAIARTEIGTGMITLPLAPTAANLTQSIYFVGDAVCFLSVYVYASRPGGAETVMRSVFLCAAINILFAALDLATFWSGTAEALSFIRNANYRMLDDAVVGGLKRIVGSFPEASTFAYYTLGWFAFCTKLWISGIRPRLTGGLALASLVLLVFSTSSSGYAGMAGFLAALFVVSLAQLLTRPVPRPALAFVTIGPVLLATGLLVLRLNDPIWTVIEDIANKTVINKWESSSGVERSNWNQQALTNFEETHWLGGGVGSVRASSFPVAVLGNTGVIGALTYGGFLLSVLFRRRNRWTLPLAAACQSAARWACFAQLLAASVAGSFIDLGLPFFIFAGLACAGPEPGRASSDTARWRALVAAG